MKKIRGIIIIFLITLLIVLFVFEIVSFGSGFKLISSKSSHDLIRTSEGNLRLVIEDSGGNNP